MKNKRSYNPFLFSFAILALLAMFTAAVAIGLFYYLFSIPEPEGMSLASWPQTFTNSFTAWITCKDGKPEIAQTGLDRLEEYGLWLQVIDESGQEIFSYHKPEVYPAHYSASRLLSLAASSYEDGNTVFVNSLNSNDGTCSYIVGFPYSIGKYPLYYNGERVSRLLPVIRVILISVSGMLILLVMGYSLWLSGKSSTIIKGIRQISLRTYRPLKESGIFSEIYGAMNQMHTEICQSDALREETDRTRREWIANITHDLKTPLSPVKGYAELLAHRQAQDSQSSQEYGRIILKNVDDIEKLLNDLKLTYQLESGGISCHPREVLITRYLRELIINIINDPAFAERNIGFESNVPELKTFLDPDLFRRAIQNIIINALVHNPPDTTVSVYVDANRENFCLITIRDNGIGLGDEEKKSLFQRYYRGMNTRKKPEGSGLGLAIAKQIITLHGGNILVQSELHKGTEFVITIPPSTNLS